MNYTMKGTYPDKDAMVGAAQGHDYPGSVFLDGTALRIGDDRTRVDYKSADGKGGGEVTLLENTGKSVLGEIATKGVTRTDKDGNLLNPDGTVFTKKNTHGELKDNYANVGDLVDDAAAKNHTHRVLVNGAPVQQGLEPPTRYGDLENGRLGYIDGPRTSEPEAPQGGAGGTGVGAASTTFTNDGWPKKGQSKGHTSNLYGGQTVVASFDVPSDAKSGIGHMEVGNATKSAANPVVVRAEVNGVEVLSPVDRGGAPNVSYKIGGAEDPDTDFHVKRDDSVQVFYTPTGEALNDLILDHTVPR